MPIPDFPRLQAFFDMHMPSTLPRVMGRLEPKRFADRLADAGVELVGLFAKGMYGNAYYDTSVGKRHPGLSFDFLGEVSRACGERGMSVLAYLSVAVDDLAGREEPSWRGVQPDGSPTLYRNHWHTVCASTEYTARFLAMAEEVLRYESVGGLWLDGRATPQGGCLCETCRRLFEEQVGRSVTGEDITEARPEWVAFVDRCDGAFRQAVTDVAARAGRPVWVGPMSVAALPHLTPKGEVRFFTEAEVWPRDHHRDIWAATLRGLLMRRQGWPYQAITTFSFGGWGEYTMKPFEQLRYEAALSACQGGSVALGKNLAPDGTLYEDVVEGFRDAFAWLRPRVPFCGDDRAPQPIGVLCDTSLNAPLVPPVAGAASVCLERHLPFDITPLGLAERDGPEAHALWILSDRGDLPPSWDERLAPWLASGGRLLVTGTPPRLGGENLFARLGLCAAPVRDDVEEGYADLSATPESEALPLWFPGAFWRVEPGAGSAEGRIRYLMSGEGDRIAQRSGPPGPDANAPAVVSWDVGEGRVVYVPFSLFTACWERGYAHLSDLAVRWVEGLALDKVPFEIDPAYPVTVYGAWAGDSYRLHLINEPTRRPVARSSPPTPARRFTPIRDMPVTLRLPNVERVTLQPDGADLPVEDAANGRCVRVPTIDQYVILEIATA